MAQSDIDRMTVAYARLQEDLGHGEAFVTSCFAHTGELAGCALMAQLEGEQRALVSDIELLSRMLEPRS